MKMILVNLFCVLIFSICAIHCTTVTECKATGKGKPPVTTEVALGDCVDPPCSLKRGEKSWINMTFTADEDYPKLTTNIFATMMGMKHGYPGLNSKNACPFMYPGCPMQKGEKYTFAIELDVKKSFPKVSVPLHFAIKDDGQNRDVACFETTIKLV